MNLVELGIGRKLANSEGESRKIAAFEGVPALGLDALASCAYGPEAALTICWWPAPPAWRRSALFPLRSCMEVGSPRRDQGLMVQHARRSRLQVHRFGQTA